MKNKSIALLFAFLAIETCYTQNLNRKIQNTILQLQKDMESRVVEINVLTDSTFKLNQAVTSHQESIQNINSVEQDQENTIEQHKKDIDENAQDIDELTGNVDSLNLSPIGKCIKTILITVKPVLHSPFRFNCCLGSSCKPC